MLGVIKADTRSLDNGSCGSISGYTGVRGGGLFL